MENEKKRRCLDNQYTLTLNQNPLKFTFNILTSTALRNTCSSIIYVLKVKLLVKIMLNLFDWLFVTWIFYWYLVSTIHSHHVLIGNYIAENTRVTEILTFSVWIGWTAKSIAHKKLALGHSRNPSSPPFPTSVTTVRSAEETGSTNTLTVAWRSMFTRWKPHGCKPPAR